MWGKLPKCKSYLQLLGLKQNETRLLTIGGTTTLCRLCCVIICTSYTNVASTCRAFTHEIFWGCLLRGNDTKMKEAGLVEDGSGPGAGGGYHGESMGRIHLGQTLRAIAAWRKLQNANGNTGRNMWKTIAGKIIVGTGERACGAEDGGTRMERIHGWTWMTGGWATERWRWTRVRMTTVESEALCFSSLTWCVHVCSISVFIVFRRLVVSFLAAMLPCTVKKISLIHGI